jgi:hypothetical protein
MKRLLRVSSLVLVLVVVAGGSARAQVASTSAEDAVRGAEYSRREALLSADTVLLSRLTAPEFYEVNRFGQYRTRASNMQEIASRTLRLLTVNFDSLSVRIYDNVAILTGIADNTGEYRGYAFSGKIRYSRVFVRRDGRWQAVLMQHTSIQ